jgi:hypothetical protein
MDAWMVDEFIGDELYRHPNLPLRIVRNPKDPPDGYVALIGGNGCFIQHGTLRDLTDQFVTPDEVIRRIDGAGTVSYSLKRAHISSEEFQIALLHTALAEEKRRADYFMNEMSKKLV